MIYIVVSVKILDSRSTDCGNDDLRLSLIITQLMREAIIRWFRTCNRLDMKTGLLELQLKKNINYIEIERHFKQEVNSIIEKEIEFI